MQVCLTLISDRDKQLTVEGYEFHHVYQLLTAFFVFWIIPGLGLLYGGMSSRKSALSMMFQSFAAIAVGVVSQMLQHLCGMIY